MKIAVTYKDNEVFQHFGKTETFKFFEIEDNKIINSEVVSSNVSGHDGLSNFLHENNVDILICGGIGDEAISALIDYNIEIYAGIEGNVDEVINKYLNNTLEPQEGHCDHHDRGEEHECCCGHHDDEEECSCSGSCGSGCSGCCSSQYLFDGKNVGKTLSVHYLGTYNDGTTFDSSYDRNAPIEFVCGAGMMILGFDKACADLNPGDIINIHLNPQEAYGEYDENLAFTIKYSQLPGSDTLELNQRIILTNANGQQLPVKVTNKTEETITLDANHEMAGKELNFKIELVSIK